MFERIITVDWSGAASDDRANDGLAVAVAFKEGDVEIERPDPLLFKNQVNWQRSQLICWLGEQLKPEHDRTLLLLDFPFSFPYGTGSAWGAGSSWTDLVEFVAERYAQTPDPDLPARATAEAINEDFGKAFRSDDDRCHAGWYLEKGVSYYRATELAVSQAISEFYAGSGAQVAFSALSGIQALAHFLELRDRGRASFEVWPFETRSGNGNQHVVAEMYPAIFPDPGIDESTHHRDARRAALAVQKALASGTLHDWFHVPHIPFGRYEGVTFEEQIKFEGWIFGIH